VNATLERDNHGYFQSAKDRCIVFVIAFGSSPNFPVLFGRNTLLEHFYYLFTTVMQKCLNEDTLGWSL